MRAVKHHGITLATDSFGNPGHPALVLVMGATASMLGWPDALCAALAERGLYVIRFDHRDTGQSTTVAPGAATYAVEDMAQDTIAILDAYGLDAAHLAGMSLGGYIAQMLAVLWPKRVASLTLIASEPLGWDRQPLPHISDEFLAHFGALAVIDWSGSAAVMDFLLTSQRLCAGPWGPFDEDRERARIRQVMARTNSIASMFNHGTLTTRGDWTGRFREITCPTLVLHGEDDPILPVQNGRAIADGIPGAVITVYPKVGHEIPAPRVFDVADRIADHIKKTQI